MKIETLPELIVAVLTLASILGAAGSVFRLSLLKATVSNLRGANDDLTARVAFLEAEDVRNKAQITIGENARAALEKVITGRDQLDKIETKVDEILGRLPNAPHRPTPA